MFNLELEDSTAISQVGDPSDPAYRPVFIDMDSTDTTPDPSPGVMCYLRLPAGFECMRGPGGNTGGALVTFVGATANYWEATVPDTINPLIPSNSGWGTSVRLDVEDGQPTRFFVRTRTVFGEVPVDDRSVGINVFGEIVAA